VNYENFNVNDLTKGHEEWMYLGYAYKVAGFNSVVKVQYYRPLVEDASAPVKAPNPYPEVLKYTGQLRVGYQVIF
jgi:hypothetical protein